MNAALRVIGETTSLS